VLVSTAARRRLRGLDALRGIAALAVCLFHYTYSFPRVTGRALDVNFVASAGHYGVDLFFIISGFVIFMTLEKNRSVYDFIDARIARIYPAFWAALLIAVAVLCFSGLPMARPGVAEFLANVSLPLNLSRSCLRRTLVERRKEISLLTWAPESLRQF